MAAPKRSNEEIGEISKKLKIDGSVQEKDVGVLRFINPQHESDGFRGLIKQRYSDFQVHEVSGDGNVVYLSQIGLPKPKEMEEPEKQEKSEKSSEKSEKSSEKPEKSSEDPGKPLAESLTPSLTPETKADLLKLISEDDLSAIESIFHTGSKVETKTAITDKSERTKFHQLISKGFNGKLETITSPDHTFCVAMATSKTRKPNNRNKVQNGVVNYGLGPFKKYLHFTLYKENRETMEVASKMAKFLRVPNGRVQYAGTKDRRGVTTQRMCVNRGQLERVNALSKGLTNCELGDFAFEEKGLDLGGCWGNEFTIAIRGVTADHENSQLSQLVGNAAESLKNHGYINYYGLQRFGTYSVSTHVIGKELLRSNWRGAAELLLSDQSVQLPESRDARKKWEATGDARDALPLMPTRCVAEHALLAQLAKEERGEDGLYAGQAYFTAIMKIPKNLRLIYVHAYQSYVWNVVALKRIDMFGTNVQEGDLIMVEAKNPENRVVADVVDGQEFLEDVAGSLSDKVRPLTAEDVKSGRYSIFDVVIPLPGYDVQYPNNDHVMQVYRDVMSRDGFDPFDMARRVQEFSMAGSYRPLMGRVHSLSYEMVQYASDNDDILMTDKDMLCAGKDPKTDDRIIRASGDQTAIVLRLRLALSCYATMALREFMKVDTSRFGSFVGLKTDN